MRVLARDRGSGKTLALMLHAADCGSYIVCHSHQEAHRIAQLARDKGLRIPFPLTYSEFIRHEWFGRGIASFAIDNADMLLQEIAKEVPVTMATLTAEDE